MPEQIPDLIAHIFWERKEQFLLDRDMYISWVLFAVEEGTFEYRIGDAQGQAGFGDIVLCPPYTAFHRKTISTLSFHAITFDFSEQSAARTLDDELPERKITFSETARLSENYRHLRLADQMLDLQMSKQKLKQHYFDDIWLMMRSPFRPFADDDSNPGADELIRRVAMYLKANASRPLELKQIAFTFGLTPVQLIRRFKTAYRMNPLQFITSIRLKSACSLLLETDWKLDAIAGECGYENGYYLSRVFSKHMGISPSSFRKQNRL
ncbi:HTH-type transcriptional activator RhaR [Paenibacillus solanacearum]|uniref:HTH-type transcriptional activator RhaR n=1 Tax=Paenibacillus solanacearum TaxID=2048548 RepID=A0A916NKA6_9BACL|nr:AraC family transcriptional regulator [Paenibacillus solanacearum]CAG7639772.1 HTH-type transcriptional activator RhaR [Paenibacillus solanacearum]